MTLVARGEPQKVSEQADICVGGTRFLLEARGKVVLIEKQNCLGGTATSGLVNVWHSLYDTDGQNQIIAGLTFETIERLQQAGALKCTDSVNSAYQFNSQELKIELDRYIKENKIKLYLHTYYSTLLLDGNRIKAAVIENKDGRSAIKADFFIDATGDGDRAGLEIESYRNKTVQPPSACFLMKGRVDSNLLSQVIGNTGMRKDLRMTGAGAAMPFAVTISG